MPRRALLAAAISLALPASPAFAADPLRDQQWGLEMVKAQAAWGISTGVGATVAVIDTGVQRDHPDFGGRLLWDKGYDFVGDDPFDEDDDDEDPRDGNGHGTHVAGIVVANRDNGEGIAGIAPDARVVPYRVLDDDGGGEAGDVISAIHRAIDDGVDVINLSLGDFIPLSSTLVENGGYASAIRRAVGQGIAVVIAAGNNGLPKCENPEVAGMLCVGAVDSRGLRSVYSSFGSNVDLMAPGGSGPGGTPEDVLSTWNDSDYFGISGTSQAAPHVAGVAALLASLGVRGAAAADRIVETAAPAGSSFEYGAGIVDAQAAVAGFEPVLPPDSNGNQARGSFSTRKRVRVRAVKQRGFRVKCLAVRPGRCEVVVRHRGRRIARGRAAVPADVATRVTAPLNRRGRRLMKRVERRIRVRMKVTLPGEAARFRRIIVRR